MTLIEEIESFITILPVKDQNIAKCFLKNRKFEELKEIIDSDIYKAEKEKKQIDETSKEYVVLESNLDAMTQMKNLVDDYINQINFGDTDDYDPTIEDYNDDDESEFLNNIYYMYCCNSTLID
ncbi:MAG: hypothetical protein MSC51_03915 [Mollicutes bacterium]|nr:hypothetical protein [Mollicutes bacterium]